MGAKGKGGVGVTGATVASPLLPPPHARQAGSRGPLSCCGWRHKIWGRDQVPRLCLSSAANPELLFPSAVLEDSFLTARGNEGWQHGCKEEVPLACPQLPGPAEGSLRMGLSWSVALVL